MKASPTAQNALLFNSFVLGIHNYFNRATHVYNEFSRLAYELRPFIYNRLKPVGKFEHPTNPPPVYRKFYSLGIKIFKVCGVYLFPLADVKTRNNMNFSQSLTPFTKAGRGRIPKQLQPDIQREISLIMKSSLPARSVEYLDNRISRYSMNMGKCEITGTFLCANDVHCHHYIPIHLGGLGGNDKFNNLRILHKDVHRLIHHTDKKTIDILIIKLGITKSMLQKINKYRQMSGLEQI